MHNCIVIYNIKCGLCKPFHNLKQMFISHLDHLELIVLKHTNVYPSVGERGEGDDQPRGATYIKLTINKAKFKFILHLNCFHDGNKILKNM